MKKALLLTMLWFTAGSVYVLAGQGDSPDKGGITGIHEAKFNVYDYTTKKPVANAGLYDKVGKQLGKTNQQGVLVLQLPATSADVYVVKMDGFTPINIRLTQAEKKSADYEVFLQPKGTQPIEEKPNPTVAQGGAPKKQELVKVYVKQDPTAYNKSKESNPSKVEFAVQLSASAKPITDKKSIKSWEDLGPVYVHNENGLYKLRIGPFDTQEDAKAVLLQAKARGTKDAFIVVQQGLENHKPYEFPSHPAEETTTAGKTEPVTKAEPVAKPVAKVEPVAANEPKADQTVPQGEYKVRLASYLHPGSFNTKDIDQYGKLESYRQGDLTIMLIGGFKNEADAKKVRDQVITKGYKDAVVVIDQDGILVETK
jgi:hypothetical protein